MKTGGFLLDPPPPHPRPLPGRPGLRSTGSVARDLFIGAGLADVDWGILMSVAINGRVVLERRRFGFIFIGNWLFQFSGSLWSSPGNRDISLASLWCILMENGFEKLARNIQ